MDNQHLIETLLSWVKSGEIAILEIQRPFVWDATKVRKLMDACIRASWWALKLRKLDETRERWPAVDLKKYNSIRFHITHSAQREVDILRDQLLARFEALPTQTSINLAGNL